MILSIIMLKIPHPEPDETSQYANIYLFNIHLIHHHDPKLLSSVSSPQTKENGILCLNKLVSVLSQMMISALNNEVARQPKLLCNSCHFDMVQYPDEYEPPQVSQSA
jgi:hypothetical protein